jgi:hypothetical protein
MLLPGHILSPRIHTAKNPPAMLFAHLLRDVRLGQPHELGERRVRPAAPAGQRRDNAGHRPAAAEALDER